MGVVRDVTVDNLVTAVGNIDTSSLAQDSTLQDVVTAIGNISGGNDPVTNTTVNSLFKDTTGQSIASAISGLGATLGRKIIIDTVQFTTTQTLNSQVDYTFTFDVGKTGYTPLGIVSITKSGSYNTRFNQNKWFISENNVSITLRCSEAGVSANGITIDVTILYSQL